MRIFLTVERLGVWYTRYMENPEVNGAELITEERIRQIAVEHYSLVHDDDHDDNSLILAAITYARIVAEPKEDPSEFWPWRDEDWKPDDGDIRNLTKAGALIAAEIDRLLRRPSPPIHTKEEMEAKQKEIELLQKTIQNLRQEAHDKEHPRVWGYDG